MEIEKHISSDEFFMLKALDQAKIALEIGEGSFIKIKERMER